MRHGLSKHANVGETFSSSDKWITGQRHAPSELPAAFSGVLAFHRNERTGEPVPNREHLRLRKSSAISRSNIPFGKSDAT
jgi:hypothetical protein